MTEFVNPTVELLVKRECYRYLWIKQVVGFAQSVHCGVCLKGIYSKLVSSRHGKGLYPAGTRVSGHLETSQAQIVYVCGVTSEWSRNLHIALRKDDSAAPFEFENDDIYCRFSGLEPVPIVEVPGAMDAVDRKFWSCRNWQLGWHAFPEDRQPFRSWLFTDPDETF